MNSIVGNDMIVYEFILCLFSKMGQISPFNKYQ